MVHPTSLPSRESDRLFIANLLGLTRAARLADYRAGLFSARQLWLWTTHFPDEAPLVNDEVPWIALRLADLD